MVAHGTVGLQHAAMALYNLFCGRVPVYIIVGNTDATARRPGIEWLHSVQDAAVMVREFIKGTTIRSRSSISPSQPFAYKIMMTAPRRWCCWSPTANWRRGRSRTKKSCAFQN